MSIAESSLAPYIVVALVVVVLAGFARKSLVHLLILLAAQVVLFAIFPKLLLQFVELVGRVGGWLRAG